MKNFNQALPLLFLMLFSCSTDKSEYKFLFIGHSYNWGKFNSIDSRILDIPLSDYDGFWFGGDICSETSLNPTVLKKLDQHFNFKNPNNHIVLGNHDYRNHNHEIYQDVTGRPDFYTSGLENMVVSVMNTNLNSRDCEKLNEQYRMLEQVTDTISKASHYVLLMHHQIFPLFDGMKSFKSNGILDHYSMNCDEVSSTFIKTIYPKLVALEERGTEVIVVVGDSGWQKGAQEETNNGVTFISSGINNTYQKKKKLTYKDGYQDNVLEFKLNSKARTLEWKFVVLNNLVGVKKEDWLATE